MVNGNIAEDIEQGVNLIREIGEERGGSVIFTYAENLLTKLGAESKCRRVAFEALLIIIRSDPKKCAHLFNPMLDALGEGIELLVGTFIFIRKFLQTGVGNLGSRDPKSRIFCKLIPDFQNKSQSQTPDFENLIPIPDPRFSKSNPNSNPRFSKSNPRSRKSRKIQPNPGNPFWDLLPTPAYRGFLLLTDRDQTKIVPILVDFIADSHSLTPFLGYIFFSILIQGSAINPRDFRHWDWDLGFIL